MPHQFSPWQFIEQKLGSHFREGLIHQVKNTYFYRRRQFLINKSLQWSFLIISLTYVFLSLIATSSVFFIPLMIDIGIDETYSEKTLLIANQILYLHTHFWPVVFLCLIAICLHSIHISHKIAGPLYRFNHIFKNLHDGILPQPIRLRQGDYLLPEMETLNDMLRSLRHRVADIQATQARLSEAIVDCEKMVPHASTDDLMQGLKHLAEKGNALGDKLASFKIEP